MRPLRPIEHRQAADVEALRRRWRDAVDRLRLHDSEANRDAETTTWRAYRDAAYERMPGDPS